MGCCPLDKLVSKAFGKRNGKNTRRRHEWKQPPMMISSPQHPIYARPVAKSINFSNEETVIVIPTVTPDPRPETLGSPPPLAATPTPALARPRPEAAEAKHVRFADGPPGARPPPELTVRYAASPLVVPEERERRRDYFSRECHYYPTPLREGIYSIATDANGLTNIFSEENPNACSIV